MILNYRDVNVGLLVTLIKVGWSLSETTKPIILRKTLFFSSLFLTHLSSAVCLSANEMLSVAKKREFLLFNVTGKAVPACIWQGEVYAVGEGLSRFSLEKYLEF